MSQRKQFFTMEPKFALLFLISASCVFSDQTKYFMETQVSKSLIWMSGADIFPGQPCGNMTSADEVCFLNIPAIELDKDGHLADNRKASNVMIKKKCLEKASGKKEYTFQLKMKLAGWYTCRGTMAVGGPETWFYINVSEPVEADPWYEDMWSMTTHIAIAACNLAFVVAFTGAQALKRKHVMKMLNAKRVYRNHLFKRSRTLDDPGLGE